MSDEFYPTPELEAIRESMNELEGLSKQALLEALFQAHRELTRIERLRNQWQQSDRVSMNMRDMYKRRTELAAAICRDDEEGLGNDALNRIAEIIWPSVPDVTSIPTGVILTTKGDRDDWLTLLNHGERLLGMADGLMTAIENALPAGFEMGEGAKNTLKTWREESAKWRKDRVSLFDKEGV